MSPTVLSNPELVRPVLEHPQKLGGVEHSAILCKTAPALYWHWCWQKVFSIKKKRRLYNSDSYIVCKKAITARQAKTHKQSEWCGIHFLCIKLISQTLVLVFSGNYVFQQHLSFVLTSLSECAICTGTKIELSYLMSHKCFLLITIPSVTFRKI